jgi:hypothetical protein
MAGQQTTWILFSSTEQPRPGKTATLGHEKRSFDFKLPWSGKPGVKQALNS